MTFDEGVGFCYAVLRPYAPMRLIHSEGVKGSKESTRPRCCCSLSCPLKGVGSV